MPFMAQPTRGLTWESNFSSPSASATMGTVLTANASANTLGTKSELIASTAYESCCIEIQVHNGYTSAAIRRGLSNIYTGGAGSEVALISNLAVGEAGDFADTSDGHIAYRFPLRVPAGTRLSADYQGSTGGSTVAMMIEVHGGGQNDHWCGTKVETLGANTATSGGTIITPGTSWAEGTLTSIGTNTHLWKWVEVGMVGGGDSTFLNATTLFDMGVAAAALAGLQNFTFTSGSNERIVKHNAGRHCFIPAGTALYGRAASSSGAPETHDFILYGVY